MIISNQKVRFGFYRDGNLGTRPNAASASRADVEAGTATFAARIGRSCS